MLRVAILVISVVGLLVFMRRAAGRLAPRVAFAPLAFLVTRVPVLVVWALGAVGWLVVLVPQALAKGHDSAGNLVSLFLIALLSGGGVAVMVVGPVFMVLRAFAPPPVFALERDEELVFEAPAAHFLDGEARGGKLVVTSQRIGFRPHRFNVQLAVWSMKKADVAEVTLEGTQLLVVRSRAGGPDAWLTVTGRGEALARQVRTLVSSNAEPASG